MDQNKGDSRAATESERIEHGDGPKPADLGDTDPMGQPDSVRSAPEGAAVSAGRQRGETEMEQRPDQEQATRAYPREEQGTYDPAEKLAEGANPSDPRSYADPTEGTRDMTSRSNPTATRRSPDAVDEQSVADHNNMADTRGPDGIAATGDSPHGEAVYSRTTGGDKR